MEDLHWKTAIQCSMCEEIPQRAPRFQCEYKHQYCQDCFERLKRNYKGTQISKAICIVCKAARVFSESEFTDEFLRKVCAKPGIGRRYRYDPSEVNKNNSSMEVEKPDKNQVTLQDLFKLPKSDINELMRCKAHTSRESRDEIRRGPLSSRTHTAYSKHRGMEILFEGPTPAQINSHGFKAALPQTKELLPKQTKNKPLLSSSTQAFKLIPKQKELDARPSSAQMLHSMPKLKEAKVRPASAHYFKPMPRLEESPSAPRPAHDFKAVTPKPKEFNAPPSDTRGIKQLKRRPNFRPQGLKPVTPKPGQTISADLIPVKLKLPVPRRNPNIVPSFASFQYRPDSARSISSDASFLIPHFRKCNTYRSDLTNVSDSDSELQSDNSENSKPKLAEITESDLDTERSNQMARDESPSARETDDLESVSEKQIDKIESPQEVNIETQKSDKESPPRSSGSSENNSSNSSTASSFKTAISNPNSPRTSISSGLSVAKKLIKKTPEEEKFKPTNTEPSKIVECQDTSSDSTPRSDTFESANTELSIDAFESANTELSLPSKSDKIKSKTNKVSKKQHQRHPPQLKSDSTSSQSGKKFETGKLKKKKRPRQNHPRDRPESAFFRLAKSKLTVPNTSSEISNSGPPESKLKPPDPPPSIFELIPYIPQSGTSNSVSSRSNESTSRTPTLQNYRSRRSKSESPRFDDFEQVTPKYKSRPRITIVTFGYKSDFVPAVPQIRSINPTKGHSTQFYSPSTYSFRKNQFIPSSARSPRSSQLSARSYHVPYSPRSAQQEPSLTFPLSLNSSLLTDDTSSSKISSFDIDLDYFINQPHRSLKLSKSGLFYIYQSKRRIVSKVVTIEPCRESPPYPVAQQPIASDPLFDLPRDLIYPRQRRKSFFNNPTKIYESSNNDEKMPKKMQSRRPITCPETDCKRFVTPTGFLTHYLFEHSKTPKYTLKKSDILILPLNINKIQHNYTYCLGIIDLYEEIEDGTTEYHKNILDKLWVLVSGSPTNITPQFFIWVFCPIEGNKYSGTMQIEIGSGREIEFTFEVQNTYNTLEYQAIVDNFTGLLVTASCLSLLDVRAGLFLKLSLNCVRLEH